MPRSGLYAHCQRAEHCRNTFGKLQEFAAAPSDVRDVFRCNVPIACSSDQPVQAYSDMYICTICLRQLCSCASVAEHAGDCMSCWWWCGRNTCQRFRLCMIHCWLVSTRVALLCCGPVVVLQAAVAVATRLLAGHPAFKMGMEATLTAQAPARVAASQCASLTHAPVTTLPTSTATNVGELAPQLTANDVIFASVSSSYWVDACCCMENAQIIIGKQDMGASTVMLVPPGDPCPSVTYFYLCHHRTAGK